MATNQDVLAELVKQTGPASRDEIAKGMGVKVNDIATPLKRLSEKNPPLVTVNDEGHFTITEEGRKTVNPVTEDGEGVTENQVFKSYGVRIGIPREIVELTQEHIWDGGDWKDLNWVKKGLNDMKIKSDLLDRWFSVWQSYLQKRISPEDKSALAEIGVTPETPSKVTDSKDSKPGATNRLRDYIIDNSNNVMYVGEGNGDLEYPDAVRITTLRAASAGRISVTPADGAGVKSSPINDAKDLLMAVNELSGGSGKRKSVILMPNDEGGYTLQEIEAGSTVSIPRSGGAPASPKGFYIDPETNEVKEIDPMKPTIIIKNAPAPAVNREGAVVKNYLYKEDGTMVEIEAGKPIIINQPSKSSNSSTMLNAVTPDGKSIVIDIDSYFKLEDHKARIQREQESHEMKMDIGKGLKDLVTKGVRALGHMSEDDGEE